MMNVPHYRSLMKDNEECCIISSHWPLKYLIHHTVIVAFLPIFQITEFIKVIIIQCLTFLGLLR